MSFDAYCQMEADSTVKHESLESGSVTLDSIRCELPVADVYRDPLAG